MPIAQPISSTHTPQTERDWFFSKTDSAYINAKNCSIRGPPPPPVPAVLRANNTMIDASATDPAKSYLSTHTGVFEQRVKQQKEEALAGNAPTFVTQPPTWGVTDPVTQKNITNFGPTTTIHTTHRVPAIITNTRRQLQISPGNETFLTVGGARTTRIIATPKSVAARQQHIRKDGAKQGPISKIAILPGGKALPDQSVPEILTAKSLKRHVADNILRAPVAPMDALASDLQELKWQPPAKQTTSPASIITSGAIPIRNTNAAVCEKFALTATEQEIQDAARLIGLEGAYMPAPTEYVAAIRWDEREVEAQSDGLINGEYTAYGLHGLYDLDGHYMQRYSIGEYLISDSSRTWKSILKSEGISGKATQPVSSTRWGLVSTASLKKSAHRLLTSFSLFTV
jgi:hypothetical protein